jgi:molecular chaperone DnaK
LQVENGRLTVAVGIETLGGVFTPLLPAGTAVPAAHTEIFTTGADNQPSVEVHLLAGNGEKAAENRSLGKFSVVGIRKARRGTPQIEVAISIDERGALSVSARDLDTGEAQKITVLSAGGLER